MFQSLFNQLQSPDSSQRKQAVNTLGAIRHPRAKEALRYVYRNDPDGAVREAALQYLPGIRAQLGLPPVPARTASASAPDKVVWDCAYCGTRDIAGAACPNCGSSRLTSADENKKAAQTPAALATLFQNPLPGGPNGQRTPPDQLPLTTQQARRLIRQERQMQRAASNLLSLIFMVVLLVIVLIVFVIASRHHLVLLR